MDGIVNRRWQNLAPHKISGHEQGEIFWAGYPPDQEARMLEGGFLRLVEPVRKRAARKQPEHRLEEPQAEVELDGAPAEVANEWTKEGVDD